jgi:hypothetical protein
MTTTTTWTVTAMDCYPQEDGNTDVVLPFTGLALVQTAHTVLLCTQLAAFL